MADDDTPAGFLGRWSRRKAEVRQGRPVAEPAPAGPIQNASASSGPAVASSVAAHSNANPNPSQARDALHATPAPQAPAPTLADVDQLTAESDFSSFVKREVTPDVKNAAMKKLFTDPHFNVMDGLDIYIDDYGIADPLPAGMLREMVGSQFLNLFDDEEAKKKQKSDVSDNRGVVPPEVVAQSDPAESEPNLEPPTHDHADLRLQPDPTPRPEGPGSEPV